MGREGARVGHVAGLGRRVPRISDASKCNKEISHNQAAMLWYGVFLSGDTPVEIPDVLAAPLHQHQLDAIGFRESHPV